jgi:hypothetical protein
LPFVCPFLIFYWHGQVNNRLIAFCSNLLFQVVIGFIGMPWIALYLLAAIIGYSSITNESIDFLLFKSVALFLFPVVIDGIC